MLTSYSLAIARCQRFVDADSDFDLRAIVGQTDPDHAHTMTEGRMYASLTGIMQSNVAEVLKLVREQQEQIRQMAERADKQVELIDRQAARIDRLLHIETASR